MTESVEELKRNSRTIRQAKAGLYDEFGKFGAAAVLLIAGLSGASVYLQVAGAAVIAIWCLVSLPRWRRVQKYRIEDHCNGVNTKDAP